MPPETNVMTALLDDPEWAAQSVKDESEIEQPAEEEVSAGPEDEPVEGEDEGAEETEGDEDEETGEDEQEEEGADDEVAAEEVGEDVELKAFLAKYGNDPDKALKGASELSRLLGRQARDLTKSQEENARLRQLLADAQVASAGMAPPLNEEQRAWVEGAATSPNPVASVQQAMGQGEFELARAVCREWALTSPYDALQLGQWVNQKEAEVYQAYNQPVPITTEQAIEALSNEMPEMQAYLGVMNNVVAQLGPNHPLVQEARSQDAREAMNGLIGIFEIARASTATVADAQPKIKKKQREDADDERAKGLVSSATNSPSHAETPRPQLVMPGLTREALDTEFAAQAGR